jgi:hypothetical protein
LRPLRLVPEQQQPEEVRIEGSGSVADDSQRGRLTDECLSCSPQYLYHHLCSRRQHLYGWKHRDNFIKHYAAIQEERARAAAGLPPGVPQSALSGMPLSGMPPPGMASPGMAPPGMAPPGMMPPGMMPPYGMLFQQQAQMQQQQAHMQWQQQQQWMQAKQSR